MEADRKYRQSGIIIMIKETGDFFETKQDCARALNVTPSMISYVLKNPGSTVRGFHIEIVDAIPWFHIDPDIEDALNKEIGCYYAEWRDHPTRPNVYVSHLGHIAKNKNGIITIKKQHLINSGYLVVCIGDYAAGYRNNLNELVHVLVAETFVPNPHNLPDVDHIDTDKTNNACWNLEWVTKHENMRRAYANGLIPTIKVRVEETGDIFSSLSECARAIGGTISGIHDCKSGRQKQHRGYHFSFLEENDCE